jgi:hypothetical protein
MYVFNAIQRQRWLICLTCAATLFAPAAQAEVKTSVSGFGSLGAGRVLTQGGTFEDYDTRWSYDTDTVVGVQLDVAASQGITFTTQAVARGFDVSDVETQYAPELELMFIAYQATDNLRLRGGLIRPPLFIHSESLEVGYTYPWVRPPIDVYSTHAQSLTHMKGVDASYYLPVGDGLLEWRLVYGAEESRVDAIAYTYDIDFEPLLGSTFTLNWNEWLMRYSLYRTSSTFDSAQLSFVQDFYRDLASEDPFFNVLATNLAGRNVTTIYQVMGVQLDRDNWTFSTEFAYEAPPEEQYSVGLMGVYVSVAKQIGKYSPYVILSYAKSEPSDYLYDDLRASESIQVSEEKRGLLELIQKGTYQAYDAVNFSNTRQAVGLRYDINDHIDIKSELEYYAIERKSDLAGEPDDQFMLTIVIDWVL